MYQPCSRPYNELKDWHHSDDNVDMELDDSYLADNGTTINHFYEKLLLPEDRMNTGTGRAIAEKRHQFTEDFLRRFYEEWEGW